MILYRYIIRKHALPFLYSFAVVIFILMMNLAVQLLNRIISKGLDPGVVLELFLIQMGWVIALALPMAVLVATLMAFGTMSADNEILAIKASGRSLYTLLLPVLSAATLLGVLLVFFNNLILPDANHRLANLTSDITRKKPAAFIEPRVFIRDFSNYVLYVDRVQPRSGMLHGVMIFADAPGQNPSTTIADSGHIRITPNGEHLQLTLHHGESHSINRENHGEHFIARFERQLLFIKNVDSRLQRTERSYRSDREKSAQTMLQDISGFRTARRSLLSELDALIDSTDARLERVSTLLDTLPGADSAFDTITSFAQWARLLDSDTRFTAPRVQSTANRCGRIAQQVDVQDRKIAQYLVEVHKKYSIPVTTLVFALIGAPLGIMARRGGLAVGTTYSIMFFVLFWVFLIGGESLADRLIVPPWLGMWGGNILVGAAAALLVLRMVRETTFISFDPLLRLMRRGGASRFMRTALAPLSAARWVLGAMLTIPLAIVRRIFGILPVYLIRAFLGYLAGVLSGMLAIFVIIDYIQNLRRFEGAPLLNVALYYWYYLPWIVLMVLPVIVLLAGMGAMGVMAKNGEVTAMRASGISIRQLVSPLLLLGALLSAGSFYVGERLLPEANHRRRMLHEDIMDSRSLSATGRQRQHREFRRNFYYFGNSETVYRFDEFRTHPTRTRDVWRESFAGNRIVERVRAASLDYRDSAWHFVNGTHCLFGNEAAQSRRFDTLADTVLSATPDEMTARVRSREEMSYWELQHFIGKLQHQGERVTTYLADLYFKIALPTMNFIVLLIGLSITARAGRKGTAVLFGIGLLITFSYWIIAQFTLAFARNGQLPPLAGAWAGNALFLLLGLLLFRRAQQ